MKEINYRQKHFKRFLNTLYNRRAVSDDTLMSVGKIISEVREYGNIAIRRYAKKFDRVDLPPVYFRVRDKEISDASRFLARDAKSTIKVAIKNIIYFAGAKLPKPWSCTPRKGVIIGERFQPLDRVAVYIPGGTAPLVSTAIHTAGIARAAGVKEIVAVTPPGKNREVHPAILYALKHIGVNEIYRLGGAYGIAAMAYGTATINKVEKIVGPGNAYVTAAKKLVYGDVAIDMVAGPSEIMIIADAECDPDIIAADMLSQAEHGSGEEQAVLVCTDSKLIQQVKNALKFQAKRLSRKEAINSVLKNGAFFIEVQDLDQAAEIAGNYAPEHLEILCPHAGNIAKKVKAAGAIFLGPWTPESVGDFIAGPSHVLPTGGSAKYFSGLSVEHFFRRMSIINYQKNALKNEVEHIEKFAEMEGLDAHGNSASIRLD